MSLRGDAVLRVDRVSPLRLKILHKSTQFLIVTIGGVGNELSSLFAISRQYPPPAGNPLTSRPFSVAVQNEGTSGTPVPCCVDLDESIRTFVFFYIFPVRFHPVISVCLLDHRVDVVGVSNSPDYLPCHPTIRKSPPRSV